MYIQFSPFEPGFTAKSSDFSNYYAENITIPAPPTSIKEQIKGLLSDWQIWVAIILLVIALAVILKKYWR